MSNITAEELSRILTKKCHFRKGAMKLYRAFDNDKDKTRVLDELTTVNLSIQLIKEQLANIENPICISCDNCIRDNIFLVVGIKETDSFDFKTTLQPLMCKFNIKQSFDDSFKEISSIRNAAVNPTRGWNGIVSMLQYCNHVSVLAARFANECGALNVPFTWYDSFTGVSYSQSSLAFEKGSVIFNVGALATQLVNIQDLKSLTGIQEAEKLSLLASSAFKTVLENFRRPPSHDMTQYTMSLLCLITSAQAVECRLLYFLASQEFDDSFFSLSNDCAFVSDTYSQCLVDLRSDKTEFFQHWKIALTVKADYYLSLAHYYYSQGIGGELAVAHLQCSALLIEKTIKNITSKDPNRKYVVNLFHLKLLNTHRMILDAFAHVQVEDILLMEIDPSPALPELDGMRFEDCGPPSFPLEDHKVDDIFIDLGPIHVFNTRQLVNEPREIIFISKGIKRFGFRIKGSQPATVCHVENDGVAMMAGLRDDDIIVSVDDTDARWLNQMEIITAIKNTRKTESCKLVVFGAVNVE